MLIWLLLILFIGLLVFCYANFHKELANPALILVLTYTICIFCCCLNISKWGVNLSPEAFIVLLVGAVEFIAVTFLVQLRYEKKNKEIPEEKESHFPIKYNSTFAIIVLCFDIITIALVINNVLDIASQFGEYNSLSEALTIYKENVDYNNNALLHPIIRIMIKFVVAFGYVSLFAMVNNFFSDKTKKLIDFIKEHIINILCCICCVLIYFFQSNRGSIISYVFGAFVILVIMWSMKNHWKKYISLKKIGYACLFCLAGLMMFYFSAKLVGRVNSKSMVDYITYYAGGSIECFNQFSTSDYEHSEVFGEQTFAHLINNLNKYGIINTPKPKNIAPFIYYNGEMVGNIYTAYQRWLYDFGIWGVIILQAILAYIYSKIYYGIKYSKSRHKALFLLFIYSFIIYCIFFHPFDSYFYLEFFCKAGIANVAALVMVYGYVVYGIEPLKKLFKRAR